MPCYDPPEPDAVLEDMRKRNNQLSALLCEACRILQGHGLMNSINASKELLRHWDVHQEFDKREGR